MKSETKIDPTASAQYALPLSTKIVLSERDWQRFIEALEEDREPTEAAKKAAERYNAGRRQLQGLS